MALQEHFHSFTNVPGSEIFLGQPETPFDDLRFAGLIIRVCGLLPCSAAVLQLQDGKQVIIDQVLLKHSLDEMIDPLFITPAIEDIAVKPRETQT